MGPFYTDNYPYTTKSCVELIILTPKFRPKPASTRPWCPWKVSSLTTNTLNPKTLYAKSLMPTFFAFSRSVGLQQQIRQCRHKHDPTSASIAGSLEYEPRNPTILVAMEPFQSPEKLQKSAMRNGPCVKSSHLNLETDPPMTPPMPGRLCAVAVLLVAGILKPAPEP